MILVQLHRANEEKYKTMWAGFRPCDNIIDFTSVSNEPINIHSWLWLINTFIEYYNMLQLSCLHRGVRILSCNNKAYYMVWQKFWNHSIRTQLACNIATVPACSTDTCCHTKMSCRRDKWHDTRHSIRIRGLTIVLSIDVERYTGVHNYRLYCTIGKPFSDLPHTSELSTLWYWYGGSQLEAR